MDGVESMLKKLSLCFLVALIAACSVSPTGRKQFIMMSDSNMDKMGVEAFNQTKEEKPQVQDQATVEYVQCVANAITALPEVQRTSPTWEVRVFDEPTVNAFALPGGKIGVYKGIIEVAATPDQLAAVLGHEVGHVMARHGNERVSQNMAVGQALGLINAWLARENSDHRQLAMGALGMGAQVGVLLPFSRLHESEADQIGLQLMAKAGFDPRQAAELWKNMAKSGGNAPLEFLSTHPSNQTRIKKLSSEAPREMGHYLQLKSSGKLPVCRRPATFS